MEENLNIIQEIFLLCIKVNQRANVNTEFDFHSGSNKLTVMLGTRPDADWSEDFIRRWNVSVKNTKALNIILKEIKVLNIEEAELEPNIEDDFLE